MMLRDMLEAIHSYLLDYPEGKFGDVRVQDEDGIYESELVGVEEANGLWLIVKTQPLELL